MALTVRRAEYAATPQFIQTDSSRKRVAVPEHLLRHHKVVRAEGTDADLSRWLAECSAEGWELVSVQEQFPRADDTFRDAGPTRHWLAVLRRLP